MGRKAIIRVKDLRAGYGEDIILDHVSFNVYEGEVFVILGGSGCGKSTLLKTIIGLIEPSAGKIVIDGYEVSADDETTLQKIFRRVGVLYQGAALFGSMTVAENVALPIREYTSLPKESVDVLVKMKLGLVNLEGYENYLPSELSGGMKKRAGLARAMALNPKILFFDEPSAGLDPVTSAELDDLILYLNERIIMLDKRAKGIIAEGNPKYLRDHSQNQFVKQFFNRQAEEKGAGGKDSQ
ncbi:MAG: ATP-binding cassette domain-containing protein [Deltaproteobacteria bacterium]|nr:ATP-binding cassette domain-containing protein [Deltaproteobacteria bacterium]